MKKKDQKRFDLAYRDFKKQNYQSTVSLCIQILEANSASANVLELLTLSLLKLGRIHDLRKVLPKSKSLIASLPKVVLFWGGISFYKAGNLSTACAYGKIFCMRFPTEPQGLVNYAGFLNSKNRFDLALEFGERALKICPDDPNALNNVAVAKSRLRKKDEALKHFEKMVTLGSMSDDFRVNYANLLRDLYRFDDAEKELQKCHQNSNVKYNLSLLKLAKLDIADGLKLSQYRLLQRDNFAMQMKVGLPFLIDARRCSGCKVLVWAEQGLGERILFYPLLFKLERAGIKVFLSGFEKLKDIVNISKFRLHEPSAGFDQYDFQLPLASIPYCFGMSKDMLTRSIARDGLRSKSFPHGERKIVIGLTWRSGNETVGFEKSLSLNEVVSNLPKSGNLEYRFMQPGLTDDEIYLINKLQADHGFQVWGLDQDWYDLSVVERALYQCNLFVSVSNTNAHLAGQLGVPTVLLIPSDFGNLWYWNLINANSSTSEIYPSIKIVGFSRSNMEIEFNDELPKAVKNFCGI